MDFANVPPEVNSASMYLGAGSAPMLDAAAAWDRRAAELRWAATAYSAHIADLTSVWRGRGAQSMVAAATGHERWLAISAAGAQMAADHARMAAQAYEAAYWSTVPRRAVPKSVKMVAVATE